MEAGQSVDMTPFTDFGKACEGVLDFLSHRYDFDLWMVTRTEGEDWIVLQARDLGYGVSGGMVFTWADSFCSRMVIESGPRVAPDVSKVAVYNTAPIAGQLDIGAYVGVPVLKADGSLFGTLCAIDPKPKQESLCEALPLFELLGQLLGTVLSSELKAIEAARLSALSLREAATDALTGLLNRRGWQMAVDTEEKRARRYGSPVCVIIVDLDELKEVNDTLGHHKGDELICSAANALRGVVRESDTVARLGGDEFALMAIEIDRENAEALLEKVRQVLKSDGVKASVGMAMRNPELGLEQAISEADKQMYLEKTGRPKS